MSETSAAISDLKSETNAKLNEVSTSLKGLAENVSELNAAVREHVTAATMTNKMNEMQFHGLKETDASLRQLIAEQTGMVDRLTKEGDKFRHDLHNMKTFSQTVVSVMERLLKIEAVSPDKLADRVACLETKNLVLESRLQGARMISRGFWFALSVAASAISWYAGHIH